MGKREWCGGGRRPPELFTMRETRVMRRRPKSAGAVYNGGNASAADAAEGRRSCLQWGKRECCEGGRRPPELFRAVFTMGLDARLSVKCAFGAFKHGKQIA